MKTKTTSYPHALALAEGNGGVDLDFDGFDGRTSVVEFASREEVEIDDLVAMFAGRRAPRFSIYS